MLTSNSGPHVARLFHTALAVVFLIAWFSLGAQLMELFGARGLLPIGALMERMHAAPGASFFEVPSVFWAFHSDAALWAALATGAACSLMAAIGLWPNVALLISTLLYLSFVTAGRTFLSFQWDNLLIECGFLAALLPRDRHAPWAHTLLRLLLFKLYFESGIAKWQSGLGDWRDGSAMLLYFETAPLPTWLAWYAHHLPEAILRALSGLTLVLELVVPCFIFGPRTLQRVALVALSGFQIINMATANYGFFCPLTLALHVFLLGDADLGGLTTPALQRTRLEFFAVALYVYVSLGQAVSHFSDANAWPGASAFSTWRLVNTYHLFGAITRARVEPEVQIDDGHGWVAYDLWHKPGDVMRAPDFVAPHQPRLDFQLWFHGLSPKVWPPYLEALLRAICEDPKAVQGFFTTPLPASPRAMRMVYWQYHFTDAATHAHTGAVWSRQWLGARPERLCQSAARP